MINFWMMPYFRCGILHDLDVVSADYLCYLLHRGFNAMLLLPFYIRTLSLFLPTLLWPPSVILMLTTCLVGRTIHGVLSTITIFSCQTYFAQSRCCSSDFSFAKIAQASCCKGTAKALTRKFFKVFGVQLRRNPKSLMPWRVENFSVFSCIYIPSSCLLRIARKNYKERLGAKH